MQHLLSMGQLTKAEITDLLDLADDMKAKYKNGFEHKYLHGKVIALIFNKCSTRTRLSFQTGMIDLGGSAIYLNGNDIQLGRGESIKDTARVLSRYVDAIMIRTYKHSDVEEMARWASIPIINGLTDYAHPCQVLADLMTIRKYKKSFDGLKLAFIGDGNNMANSLIVGCIKVGMEVAIACPKDYLPDADIVKWGYEQGKLTITESVDEAMTGADVVYTDVWASMGQESEREERAKVFKEYQVNEQNMSLAQPNAMVLHCLPAHKGEEITEETFEKHSNEIFDEAENRLHAQKAVMVTLMR